MADASPLLFEPELQWTSIGFGALLIVSAMRVIVAMLGREPADIGSDVYTTPLDAATSVSSRHHTASR